MRPSCCHRAACCSAAGAADDCSSRRAIPQPRPCEARRAARSKPARPAHEGGGPSASTHRDPRARSHSSRNSGPPHRPASEVRTVSGRASFPFLGRDAIRRGKARRRGRTWRTCQGSMRRHPRWCAGHPVRAPRPRKAARQIRSNAAGVASDAGPAGAGPVKVAHAATAMRAALFGCVPSGPRRSTMAMPFSLAWMTRRSSTPLPG